MSGVVFVDAPKAGRSDPEALSRALGIDAYRAKLLLNSRAPFLAQGFADLAGAERAAAALREAHVPATAHARERVDAVPAARETKELVREKDVWKAAANGGPLEIPASTLAALVYGKVSVQLESAEEEGGTGFGPFDLTSAPPPRAGVIPRETKFLYRLDVFAESAGNVVRLSIVHDRFDFRCLGGRKTLSAVRNVGVLRESLSQSRPSTDVPCCEAFERTELARSSIVPDVLVTTDVRGASRSQTVRSNRAAFERYAAVRFLHEIALRPSSPSHHYEL